MSDAEFPPTLEFVFAARVTVDRPLELGDVGKGGRRIVPITGGEFAGPRLRGKVVPGGADWQIVRHDGVAELEARYTLQTDDGALIYVRNHALRHGPSEVIVALAAGRPSKPQATTSGAQRSLRPARPATRGSRGRSSFARENANRRASISNSIKSSEGDDRRALTSVQWTLRRPPCLQSP
jgi:Protein of unknown function (DUF3237)